MVITANSYLKNFLTSHCHIQCHINRVNVYKAAANDAQLTNSNKTLTPHSNLLGFGKTSNMHLKFIGCN